MGALLVSSLVLSACGGQEPTPGAAPTTVSPSSTADTDELGQSLTSYEAITNYNNFYEFSFRKEGVARLAADFKTSPWEVEVAGLVHNPKTFDLQDLLAFPQEERVYRLRCVEAWSMVIPWVEVRTL
jgi:sulfoxide reductase catalytic subunit YedY